MPTAIVTGSGGLIGSATAAALLHEGFDVVGVDNDMRSAFFGHDASTRSVSARLANQNTGFRSADIDVRDEAGIDRVFAGSRNIELVVHAAGQPSHDWAATSPRVDFEINAGGTLNLLEATRQRAPGATFVLMSTNKVYGDTPNRLPFVEQESRLELPHDHPLFEGIDASMSIDQTAHSLFGVSKAAADLLVQEYGLRFDLPTACLRLGCVTGADHAGTMLHGFLAYLMRCAVTGHPYTVLGYAGKQVRDNIGSDDVARAVLEVHRRPTPGAVYNLGGGRVSSCSVREAIALCEEIVGRPMQQSFAETPRYGDHRWWISDLRPFRHDYPSWDVTLTVPELLRDIYEQNAEAWSKGDL